MNHRQKHHKIKEILNYPPPPSKLNLPFLEMLFLSCEERCPREALLVGPFTWPRGPTITSFPIRHTLDSLLPECESLTFVSSSHSC